jgi:DNA-binding NarL/FixJ family response regulator
MNALAPSRKASQRDLMESQALLDRVEVESDLAEAVLDARPIRTVLVDDSPIVLKALSLFLQRLNGFELVGTATDGYHAVRRVVELQPDLVLMDLRLPGMNGLEATRQIKARSQAPTVIMVTADDTPECRAAASAAGTDGFVGKQNLFTQLRTAIRKLFPGATL